MSSYPEELIHSLADAFNALADEAQGLNDRRVVLEHKLRFAHEQLQYLADKYAPATPEITETFAKLQLPPHTSVDKTSPVPLPSRNSPRSQHEIALIIRDGRRLTSQLTPSGEASKTTNSAGDAMSHASPVQSSMSNALEKDFTVEGRKGNLQCPFSQTTQSSTILDARGDETASQQKAPHGSADPICAAMNEDLSQQSGPVANGTGGGKCPIRYMDQHSPEEIARYVETHKHELPRSHEICLRRYQHNDAEIRKLDSKYGNIVSMIEDLGQLHQSMLPGGEHGQQPRRQSDVDRDSNERVESWAQAVVVTDGSLDQGGSSSEPVSERQSHFDRPLKEVRVGESPSRPWGIHVPVQESGDGHDYRPESPMAAPVIMPDVAHNVQIPTQRTGKCPFDNTKLPAFGGDGNDHGMPTQKLTHESSSRQAFNEAPSNSIPDQHASRQSLPSHIERPAFITADAFAGHSGDNAPRMIFTGPVFIGYPMEQAIQFMNQYRPSNA